MSTKVWTSSTCDRCGKHTNQEGSVSNLPQNWARVTIEPWSRSDMRGAARVKELCQQCFFGLDDWMRRPEINAPKADEVPA